MIEKSELTFDTRFTSDRRLQWSLGQMNGELKRSTGNHAWNICSNLHIGTEKNTENHEKLSQLYFARWIILLIVPLEYAIGGSS